MKNIINKPHEDNKSICKAKHHQPFIWIRLSFEGSFPSVNGIHVDIMIVAYPTTFVLLLKLWGTPKTHQIVYRCILQ